MYDQRRYAPLKSYCMYRLVGSTLVCVRYFTVHCQFGRLMYCSHLYIIHPLRFFVLFSAQTPASATLVCYYIFSSLNFTLRFYLYFVTYSESTYLTDLTRFE